jgi:hypothetical protein
MVGGAYGYLYKKQKEMQGGVTIKELDEVRVTFAGKQCNYVVSAAGQHCLIPDEGDITLIRVGNKEKDMPKEIIISVKNS